MADSAGNSYVLGHFAGTATFPNLVSTLDAGTTKDLFLAKVDTEGNTVWVTSAGGSGVIRDTGLFGRWITIDGDDNIIVTGLFSGTVSFGGVALIANGSWDTFIAKYSSEGTLVWARSASETGSATAMAIAADAAGGIYLTGYFTGSADFLNRDTLVNVHLSTTYTHESFIAKFDGVTAEPLWVVGPNLSATANNADLAVRNDGIGYVTGYFERNGLGPWDAYVAKFNTSDGSFLWPETVVGTGGQDYRANPVALDDLGNVFVSGIYYGDGFHFGTSDTIPGEASWNVYNTRIDPDGNVIWLNSGGGSQQEYVLSSATGPDGDLYISGFFYGAATFGNEVTSVGDRDLYVAKCNSDGQYIWAQRAGGPLEDEARSLAVDSESNILVAGSFKQTADFGTFTVSTLGSNSAYLAKLATPVVDTDGDGLLDSVETNTGIFVDASDTGTDPNNPDTDGDGLNDGEEITLSAGSGCPSPVAFDSDGDSLSDGSEISAGTNPCSNDTDADGLTDDMELALGGCLDPLVADSDLDGLSDGDELDLGTNPCLADTDGDGMLDGSEVDVAQGTGCPDPLIADSDGDTLLDGVEVALGTNPCNMDTDGDGVTDDEDPLPIDPGVTSGWIENEIRGLSETILLVDLGEFAGPNSNSQKAKRNAISNRLQNAANALANGDIQGALDKLESLLPKIDGTAPPKDWMESGPEQQALYDDVIQLIGLIGLL